jgi:metal-responsive CopG/Arc/MetJ family transcriptional regulator
MKTEVHVAVIRRKNKNLTYETFGVRFPAELVRRLEAKVDEIGVNRNNLIMQILDQHVDEAEADSDEEDDS